MKKITETLSKLAPYIKQTLSIGSKFASLAIVKIMSSLTLVATFKSYPWLFALAALSILEAFIIVLMIIF